MYVTVIIFITALALIGRTTASLSLPPSIIKQPPTDEILFQVANTDKPFLIECEAVGEPSPRYRWIKDGEKFEWSDDDGRISQQPGRGTLIFTSPRDEDAGQYQCFAENEHGTATSNSVFVRKAFLDSFKDESLKTIEAFEGETLKMQCQLPDSWPRPIMYWVIEKMDGSIRRINNLRMAVDPEGTLWIPTVIREDETENFTFACAVYNMFLRETKIGNRYKLRVNYTENDIFNTKPQRVHLSHSKEVALRSKNIELFCIYRADLTPRVVWTKDGNPIQSNDKIQETNFGKLLEITNVTFQDMGNYTCQASTHFEKAEPYTIELEVQSVPYFTTQPESAMKLEGDSVEFRCEGSGVPAPSISWIYNGKPLDEAPNNPRRIVSNNRIHFTTVQKSDTGNYGCNCSNSHGYVYKDVYLVVFSL